MKKLYLLLLAASMMTGAVAQEKFELGKPNNENYRYLDDYLPLKEYINYTAYPNFKLGAGTTVYDYLQQSTVYKLTNQNFSETVAGNAMKMASCVDGNGNMNFTTVKNYVTKATAAGLNVYGHTLAWHSQQAKGWLLKLLADKPAPTLTDGDTIIWDMKASKDFRTDKSVGWRSNETTYGYSLRFDTTNGLNIHTTKTCPNSWDVQFLAMENIMTEVGKTYKMTMTVRGSKAGTLHSKLGDWNNGGYANIPFTTAWKEVTVEYKAAVSNSFFMLQCGDFVGDIYIKSIKFEGYVGKTIPLTQQERHDTLVYAMDKWIKGMMEACGGKVKAWDLVNEAISGGGNDGSGNYVLQGNNPNGNPDATWDVGGENFYWQDYMGSLEYVRQACRLARKYGPEDVVLFINDYNLESDWDQNKKLKSLINWIKKWEADGITKIDGIGTQMHISYYENSNTQRSKKNAITNMFTLMAATGKWVRVSEMDMGYNDASGKNVSTDNMTEAQHKNMADFYEWIIKEYFRLVPPAQQWGICQWCTNDSPANSGWRANTPVGIWDINNYRKHVYAGFARGLFGEDPIEAAIDDVSGSNTIDDSKGIYDLSGRKVNAQCTMHNAQLKKGLYIVNGKKIVVK